MQGVRLESGYYTNCPGFRSRVIPKNAAITIPSAGRCNPSIRGGLLSAAVKITQTEHTAAELRGFAARSWDTAQSRRLLAIAMVLDRARRLEAARQTGMDRQTLRDWVHRYNETGIAGLLSRLAPRPDTKTDRGANG
jgi:hypothetical protein